MKFKKVFFVITSLVFVSAIASVGRVPSLALADSPITIDSTNIPVSRNTYIVKDNKTDYKIVIPESCSGTIEIASTELQRFFAEATNITLPIIRDSGLIYNQESKYISLGKTCIFDQTLLKIDDELKHSGVQIETLNKSMFLMGKDDDGVLNATYDLLSVLFNFEYFGDEGYYLDQNITSLPLRHFKHFIDNPDIPYRMSTSGRNTYNATEMSRFREQDYYTSVFSLINTVPWHNCFEYVKGDVEGHESYWYSDDQSQLCYTAHGDSNEYELMLEACLTKLIKQVKEFPDKNAATLTMNDGNSVCTCDSCNRVKEKYNGISSALHVLFCNDLRAKLENWFNTAEGQPYKRDFTLYFFAYMIATDAPINYNEETNEFSLIDGLKCNDGVAVLYAPIDMDYRMPLDHKLNQNYVRQMHGWSKLCKEMYIWTYDWGFRSYFAPYDTFECLQPLYREMKSCGNVKYIFQEGGHYMKEGATCWDSLKIYLNSKLSWNAELNVKKLIDNFFKYYFGEAGESMHQAFDAFRAYSEKLKNTEPLYACKQSCESDLYVPSYWPKGLETLINNLMDKAFKDIEKIKNSNPAKYELIYNRISLEKLSPLYMLICFYGNELDSSVLNDYRNQFKTFATNLGLTKGDFGDPIEDTFRKLGIK